MTYIRSVPSLAIAVLVAGLQLASYADAPGSGSAGCNAIFGQCLVKVVRPPLLGRDPRPSQNDGGGEATGGGGSDPSCVKTLLLPQPPKSDPVFVGRTKGSIYTGPLCRDGKLVSFVPVWSWSPVEPPAPVVTPAELARRALATVKVPKPLVHRSPPETARDGGVPYTWVNLWTWFWTDPGPWNKPPSATATLAGVSATVTLTPQSLVIKPDDGRAEITCRGPGRAWTKADGNEPPSDGGCGYRFSEVSDAVSPTVFIRWDVTWTGTGGAAGTLPRMTTQTVLPSFRVEQIQVVNR